MFCLRNNKIIFSYTLLSGGLSFIANVTGHTKYLASEWLLTLCILMDFPIQINAIRMRLSVILFKGSWVGIP